MTLRVIAVCLSLASTLPAIADEMPAGHAGHDHLGRVAFANSCSAAVQEDFTRAVAMLHSFWYSAAEPAFRGVLAKDPACAIATWGIAAILMNNPLAGAGAGPREAERAQAALEQGRRIGAATQRERDYIEAVGAYYRDFTTQPESARQLHRAAAFAALAARYPDDDEAQIFAALYLAGTQSQSEQTFAAYRRAAAVLEPMFARYPDHPGVAHYLIHAYDAPPLAAEGQTAARRYAAIAPDAPHALHMPSHIFTRIGAWPDSVATNRRAYEAAILGGEPGEAYHASDYAVYADLQMAHDADAARDMANAFSVKAAGVPTQTIAYSAASMPARYALEREDWQAAAALPPPATGPAFTAAITWFARALGAARIGDVRAAELAIVELAAGKAALLAAGNAYWAREVDVQQRTATAWAALAQGRTAEALELMRAAADLEDANEKHIVTPGRVLPARELLGDMLLEAAQPAAALQEYQASQVREPHRFRGYSGAARAADAAGRSGVGGTALRPVAGTHGRRRQRPPGGCPRAGLRREVARRPNLRHLPPAPAAAGPATATALRGSAGPPRAASAMRPALLSSRPGSLQRVTGPAMRRNAVAPAAAPPADPSRPRAHRPAPPGSAPGRAMPRAAPAQGRAPPRSCRTHPPALPRTAPARRAKAAAARPGSPPPGTAPGSALPAPPRHPRSVPAPARPADHRPCCGAAPN